MDLLVISDDSTRVELEAAIKVLAAKRDRMPAHWADWRQVLADEIDDAVEMWLVAAP